MKPLETIGCGILEWVPCTAGTFGFELRDGHETCARLVWDQHRRSMVSAECATGRWIFRRSGFVYPRVAIREVGARQDCAVFTPRWRGDGALELVDERVYHFRPTDFWWTRVAFYGSRVEKLISLDVRPSDKAAGASAITGRLEILAPGRSCPDLPLLALLGLYLLLLRRAEAPAPGPVPLIANAPTS
jgi:hypothetical protein